ncbi:MAG: Ni/Fe hydrogenase subunit alpha [Patescibacteria group bacterium]|jgi:coenzyme F420-reducing hydrogenase alpha subunit
MKTVIIKHVTRIEGHATFWGALKTGKMAEARYHTLEGARLMEGILVGRNYMDAPLVTSRICGVCPIVHNLTAIQALEKAMKVKVDSGTTILRKLMMIGQMLTSHGVHAYFMSIPDFYGRDSALDLLKLAPKQSVIALKIREFGNRFTKIIGGRALHPVNSQVGGFLKLPDKHELKKLLDDSTEVLQSAVELAHFFSHLKFPKFSRSTEYIALHSKSEYGFYDGQVVSTKGLKTTPESFIKKVEEIQSGDDYVKRTRFNGQTYWVGALSRINNNWKQLNPIAKQAFQHIKLNMPLTNSFLNVYCQGIEMIHFMEEAQKLLKKYLNMKHERPMVKYAVRAGQGVGAIEAPRGILLHYYETDKYGILKNVNIITPTAQFINNLEEDLRAYIGELKNIENKNNQRKLAMMIRAYDPCMTCATH